MLCLIGFPVAPPSGWRLSGKGGEADRVRCSRGLGAHITD
jgi:hypothetical protein